MDPREPIGDVVKRESGMSLWYCAHGLPKGFEASVFRARGFAPLRSSKTYTRMVEVAGYKIELGHTEAGDLYLWVPETLARLIPCGAELPHRVLMCTRLRKLTEPEREGFLIELDAAVRLAGPDDGFTAILGPSPRSEELREHWELIYPPHERRWGDRR